MKHRILCVAGARPNFPKIAPIMRSLATSAELEPILVHTGQHYDDKLSRVFFEDLGIPRPDISLDVGSGSHAQQIAEIMRRFEGVVEAQQPHAGSWSATSTRPWPARCSRSAVMTAASPAVPRLLRVACFRATSVFWIRGDDGSLSSPLRRGDGAVVALEFHSTASPWP